MTYLTLKANLEDMGLTLEWRRRSPGGDRFECWGNTRRSVVVNRGMADDEWTLYRPLGTHKDGLTTLWHVLQYLDIPEKETV